MRLKHHLHELAYPGNIGFQEMIQYYQKASPAQIRAMDNATKTGNWKKVKALFKKVLGVVLEENDIVEAKRSIDGYDEFVKLVKRDCKPYLKLLGGLEPMHRGMKIQFPFGVSDVRQNRRSQLFPFPDELNNWLQKQGGARRDKSVICMSPKGSKRLRIFGEPNWIFPIGNFKYSFIRQVDLNFREKGEEPLEYYFQKNVDLFTKEEIDEFLDKKFEHNKNFKEAYRNAYETWFQCKKYYYIALTGPHKQMRLLKELGLILSTY